MSGEGPPPIVPSMQTPDEDPAEPVLVRADGGSRSDREPPEDRPFGAPLVPDCS